MPSTFPHNSNEEPGKILNIDLAPFKADVSKLSLHDQFALHKQSAEVGKLFDKAIEKAVSSSSFPIIIGELKELCQAILTSQTVLRVESVKALSDLMNPVSLGATVPTITGQMKWVEGTLYLKSDGEFGWTAHSDARWDDLLSSVDRNFNAQMGHSDGYTEYQYLRGSGWTLISA